MYDEVQPVIWEVNAFSFELEQFPNHHGEHTYELTLRAALKLFRAAGNDAKLVKRVHFLLGTNVQCDAPDYEELEAVSRSLYAAAAGLHRGVEIEVSMDFEFTDYLPVPQIEERTLYASVTFPLLPRGGAERAACAVADDLVEG